MILLPQRLEIGAIPNFPWVSPGQSLARLILEGCLKANMPLENGDVLVISQKIVSKAEGCYRNLNDVTVSAEARAIAEKTSKDPRLVALILEEASEIIAAAPDVLITRHRSGHIMANAGIDRSNIEGNEDAVLLLPEDADASAADLRATLETETNTSLGIIIADSHGRPWRLGTTGVAIGVSGISALWDKRGDTDAFGRPLKVTQLALADMLASAACLVSGEGGEGRPVILIRGLRADASPQTSKNLLRPAEQDLFRSPPRVYTR